jgi:hypothetical protein
MAQNNIALSVPRHRLAVLSKIRQSLKVVRVSAQQARAESDNPVLFLESRGNDASWFGRCIDFNLNFPLPRFQPGRNKTLTCALVAEQSRTSPASSGSIAALDRMAEGLKKSSKRRERRNEKETKKVWWRCSQLFNVLFRNLLRPLPLPLPSSPFLGQPTSEAT